MQLLKTAAPTADLVNLSVLKEYLKIEHNADDDLLRHLQKSAYDWVENYIGRTLLNTQWQYTTNAISEVCEVRQALPFPPVCDIESIYHLKPSSKKVCRFTTEIHQGITYVCFISQHVPTVINYTAGYGAFAANVPDGIHLAIKTLVACWYENREGLGCGIPPLVITLLAPYQIRRLI
jgi:uncharacterized phiE125 gp8 family phage protein